MRVGGAHVRATASCRRRSPSLSRAHERRQDQRPDGRRNSPAIERRGVDFEVTGADESDLQAVARAPKVIAAARANYRPLRRPSRTRRHAAPEHDDDDDNRVGERAHGPPLAKSEIVTMLQGGHRARARRAVRREARRHLSGHARIGANNGGGRQPLARRRHHRASDGRHRLERQQQRLALRLGHDEHLGRRRRDYEA